MLQATLAFLALISSSKAFSIESAVSNIGQSQELPARSGENSQSIELRCNLQFNRLEQWTRCTWSHNFIPQIWVDNQEGFVMCSAHHQDDHERVCEDQGNLKDQYGYNDLESNPYTHYDTDRLTHNVGEDFCGLTIRSPHANDTGLWKCHVNDNNPMGQSTTMWKEVEIFVANKSVPVITRPDPNDVANSAIELDLSTSASIDAECKAMFGSPPPKIIWYIDDIDNELDSSFSSDSPPARDGTVTSSIHFDLDQQMLSRYRVKEENSFFAFSLGCRPDQDNYFTEREDAIRNPAQVMVYGRSGASLPPLLTLPLALVAVILIL